MDSSNTRLPAHRRQRILSELDSKGAVRVEELGRLFSVSEMTVRRDLDALEAEGLLERTHGGALPLRHVHRERVFREKDHEQREAKESIALLAASLIPEGETVLVNSGSTTRLVIRHLARRPDLRIITNNMAAVAELPETVAAEVLLIGGRYRPESGCAVGEWALRLLEDLAPARAILGADGISLKAGLSSPVPEEAALTRRMIEIVNSVDVVADSAKVGRVCPFRIGPLESVSRIISDSDTWAPEFREAGVTVVVPEELALSPSPQNPGGMPGSF
ncbi:MAG: DeoR/GlpR family DNA-binding transcription regulator [Spirochaetales bacterium]|nr:DeoR/GlpR family DNA-binding transcription regulator [Spirochaetales bacterium]